LIRGTKEVSSDVDASDDGNDDGERTSEEAFRKLADGTFAFLTLSGALEMLGVDGDEAERAAAELREYRVRVKRDYPLVRAILHELNRVWPSPLVRSGSIPVMIPVGNGPRFPSPVGRCRQTRRL